jgi:MFS family permease
MPETAPIDPASASAPAVVQQPSLLQPFQRPGFATLWLAWLAGNMTMWMLDVTASWRMTELTADPALVAWVQAASTLPMFVLGLASGALADLLERRRFLALAQGWIALVAAALALLALTDALTPALLLLLCLLNGVGLALRFPVFSALVPDLVPREQLSAALTLNSLAMNLTRVLGPIAAGAVLAVWGTAAVFALNAGVSVLAAVMVLRTPVARHAPPPGANLLGAIRDGVRHMRRSPRLRAILLRAFVFFGQSVGLVALLPLVAKRIGADAHTFTLLLAAMGAGAMISALASQRVQALARSQRIVDIGVAMQTVATVWAVYAHDVWTLAPALALHGAAWIWVATTMTMSAQLVLPTAMRARGMAIYQMSIMGGSALGAALWGVLASHSAVGTALLVSAAASALLLAWTQRFDIDAAA